MKGFGFFLDFEKVDFEKVKNILDFITKTGTFSKKNLEKGSKICMLEHTCVPIFPIRVTTGPECRMVIGGSVHRGLPECGGEYNLCRVCPLGALWGLPECKMVSRGFCRACLGVGRGVGGSVWPA